MNRIDTTPSFANIDIDSDSDDDNLFNAELLSEAIRYNTEESGLKQVDRGFANEALEMDMRKPGLFDFMSKSRAFEDDISAYMNYTIVINNIAPPHEIKNIHYRLETECETLIDNANRLIKLYLCGDSLNKCIVNNVLPAIENFQTCIDEKCYSEDNNRQKTTWFNLRVQLFDILKTIANDPYIPVPEDPNTPCAAIHARYKLLSLKQLQYSQSDYPTMVVTKEMQSLTHAKEWLDQNQHLLVGHNEYNAELKRTHQEAASSRGDELYQLILDKVAPNSGRRTKKIGAINFEIINGTIISESTLKKLSDYDSVLYKKANGIFSEKYIQHLQNCASESHDYIDKLETLSREGLSKFVPLLALQALMHVLKDDALFKYIKKDDACLHTAFDSKPLPFPTLSKNISEKLLKRASFWESHSSELLTHPSYLIRKHATKTYANQVSQERDKQAALKKIRDASFKLINQPPKSIDYFSKKILLPNTNALTKLDWKDLESIIRFTIQYNGKYLNENKGIEENIRYYLPLCWTNKIVQDTDGSDDDALNKALTLLKMIGYPEKPAWICKDAEASLIRSIDKCTISALKHDVILDDIGLKFSVRNKRFSEKLNEAIITRIQNNADNDTDSDTSNIDKQLGRLKGFIENGVHSLSTYIRPIIGDNSPIDSNTKEPSEHAGKNDQSDVQISESLKRTAIIRFVELSYQHYKHEILMSIFNTSNDQLHNQILSINEISGIVKDFPYYATDQQLSQYLECKPLKEYAEKEIKRRESNKQSIANITAIPSATASGLYKGGAWAAQSMSAGSVSAAKATAQGAVLLGQGTAKGAVLLGQGSVSAAKATAQGAAIATKATAKGAVLLGQGTVGVTKATTRAAVNLSKATVETTATATVATAKITTGAVIGIAYCSMLPFTYAASQMSSSVKYYSDQNKLNKIFTQDLSHNDLVEIARGNMEKLNEQLKGDIDLNQYHIEDLAIETLQQRSRTQLSNSKIDNELVNALETLSSNTGLKDINRKGYKLYSSPSYMDLPTSASRSVWIKTRSNGEFLVRIFDQSNNFKDYTNLNTELARSIRAILNRRSSLSNDDLIKNLTSYLGHIRRKSIGLSWVECLTKNWKADNFRDDSDAFNKLLKIINSPGERYPIEVRNEAEGACFTGGGQHTSAIIELLRIKGSTINSLSTYVLNMDDQARIKLYQSIISIKEERPLSEKYSNANQIKQLETLLLKALTQNKAVIANKIDLAIELICYDLASKPLRYDLLLSLLYYYNDKGDKGDKSRNFIDRFDPNSKLYTPAFKTLLSKSELNTHLETYKIDEILKTTGSLLTSDNTNKEGIDIQSQLESQLRKHNLLITSKDLPDRLRIQASYAPLSLYIALGKQQSSNNNKASAIELEHTALPLIKDVLNKCESHMQVVYNKHEQEKPHYYDMIESHMHGYRDRPNMSRPGRKTQLTMKEINHPIPIEKDIVLTYNIALQSYIHTASPETLLSTLLHKDTLLTKLESPSIKKLAPQDNFKLKLSGKINSYIESKYKNTLWTRLKSPRIKELAPQDKFKSNLSGENNSYIKSEYDGKSACEFYNNDDLRNLVTYSINSIPEFLSNNAGLLLLERILDNTKNPYNNNELLTELLSFIKNFDSAIPNIQSLAIQFFSKYARLQQGIHLLDPEYSTIPLDNNKPPIPIEKKVVERHSQDAHEYLVDNIDKECTIEELKMVFKFVKKNDLRSKASKIIKSYIEQEYYNDEDLRNLASYSNNSTPSVPEDLRTIAGTELIKLLIQNNNDIKNISDFLAEMLSFVHPDTSFTNEVSSLAIKYFSKYASLQQVICLLHPDHSSITLDNNKPPIPIEKQVVESHSQDAHKYLVDKINKECTIEELKMVFKFVKKNDLRSNASEKIKSYIEQEYYNDEDLRNLASCSNNSTPSVPEYLRTIAGTELIKLLIKNNNDIKNNSDFLAEMLSFVHPDTSFTNEVTSLAIDHFSKRASFQQVMSLLSPSSDKRASFQQPLSILRSSSDKRPSSDKRASFQQPMSLSDSFSYKRHSITLDN